MSATMASGVDDILGRFLGVEEVANGKAKPVQFQQETHPFHAGERGRHAGREALGLKELRGHRQTRCSWWTEAPVASRVSIGVSPGLEHATARYAPRPADHIGRRGR